jgi:hypothetical protein
MLGKFELNRTSRPKACEEIRGIANQERVAGHRPVEIRLIRTAAAAATPSYLLSPQCGVLPMLFFAYQQSIE